MLTKGTAEYKKASELASNLVRIASKTRLNDNTLYNLYYDPFYNLIAQIIKLNVFASQIATTIDNNSSKNQYCVANISDKQAWIIACTAIENNISVQYINA